MQITYAEIDKSTNSVRYIGHAPFLPDFGAGAPIVCVDVTAARPQPQAGWLYDPGTGTFEGPEADEGGD